MIPYPVVANPSSMEVQDLCNRLVFNGKSVLLKSEPLADTVENECYTNVAKVISAQGGSIQYGWKIYEGLPGLMVEAEFHAVWVDNEGKMHEVSKSAIPGMDTVLFLPDPTRIYDGIQIDNIRVPLKDEPLVSDFIETAELMYAAMNRGDLAGYHGNIELTPEMKALDVRSQDLFMKIMKKFYI